MRIRRTKRKSWMLSFLSLLLAAAVLIGAGGCSKSPGREEDPKETESSSYSSEGSSPQESSEEESEEEISSSGESDDLLDPEGVYTSKEDVSLYLFQYGKLPGNFITKKEARALGWEGGSVERAAPGKCIGGDRFGNYEKSLPEKEGRVYTECDINTLGAKSRGAERIIFSNDGLIYYTGDHYETFELLYGTP